jgi:signal transduction histidine kinase/PAS domain-containing protein
MGKRLCKMLLLMYHRKEFHGGKRVINRHLDTQGGSTLEQDNHRNTTTISRKAPLSDSTNVSASSSQQDYQEQASVLVRWWDRVRRWLQMNTFSPHIIPNPLARPAAGYLIACCSQICILVTVIWMVHTWPHIHFPEALPLLAIMLVALGWGTGPSIVATLIGAVLLLLHWLPPHLFFSVTTLEDSIGVFIYLTVGLMISVLTSRIQQTHYRNAAEQQHLLQRLQASERQAAERAQQLEAVFEAMTDAIFIRSTTEKATQMNKAAWDLLAFPQDERSAPLTEPPFTLLDQQGQPLPRDQWPEARLFRGEELRGAHAADAQMRTLDGQIHNVSVTGAPLINAEGAIHGIVLVCRDETEQRALERRTRKALKALLAMAQMLVLHPSRKEDPSLEERHEALQHIVQQLADLAQPVLDSKRMSISLVDQQTGLNFPLATKGLTSEEMQLWRKEIDSSSIYDYLTPELLERLHADEVLILDLAGRPPIAREYYGFGLTLAVPLLSSNKLIGIFAIDNGQKKHSYTEEEIGVVRAVAQLATLVIERERLEMERTEARASIIALQETNRLMTEFLGIAAHELRTPLTTIKASLQLAQRQFMRLQKNEKAFSDEVKSSMMIIYDLLDRAERQASRQTRLVRDLLDVSRVQANRLELRPTRFNIVTLVSEVIIDQYVQVPNRTILLESSEEEIMVRADRDRIEQVIDNYLSNGLKYSETDKPVLVRVKRKDDKNVHIQVHDEGPGLSLEQQQLIWERFYRVPGVEVKSGSGIGLGLGLHISRTLIERHDGQVGVQSEMGHGATFWFTLPIAE